MAKRNKYKRVRSQGDPYRAREARKYANPIPSREFILSLLQAHAAPLGFNDIVEQLAMADEEQQVALSRRLKAMERDGQVVLNRKACLLYTSDAADE